MHFHESFYYGNGKCQVLIVAFTSYTQVAFLLSLFLSSRSWLNSAKLCRPYRSARNSTTHSSTITASSPSRYYLSTLYPFSPPLFFFSFPIHSFACFFNTSRYSTAICCYFMEFDVKKKRFQTFLSVHDKLCEQFYANSIFCFLFYLRMLSF